MESMKLRFRMILLSAGLAIAALASAQTTPPVQEQLTAETKSGVLSGIEQILKERAFVPGLDFNKWDELVEKNKESFDNANDERSFVNSVNRALREFGISHVGLRTPRAASTRQTGRTSGLGMSTTKVDEGLRITQVVEESPAHQAGLAVGDVILTINGQKPEDLNALPTEDGQPATLTVRNATGEERTVPIVAGQYRTARKDTLTWLDERTAVMRINSFSNGYSRSELQDMIKEANDKKAESLIIDLRNNGGGAVSNLAHLLGLFLNEAEPVGTFVNRRTVTSFQEATKEEKIDLVKIANWSDQKFKSTRPTVKRFEGKVVVLTNRGSASASEIFASAMKETGRATIIGTETRGAVLASTYGRLPGGFELQYPVSDYVTLKGIRLEGNPWKPDIAVANARTSDGKDAYFEAALEVFAKG